MLSCILFAAGIGALPLLCSPQPVALANAYLPFSAITMDLGGLCRGKKSRPPSNLVSLSELKDQIECNLQHYDRIQLTSPDDGGPSAPQSQQMERLKSSPGRGPRLSRHGYDPAYEVDPDDAIAVPTMAGDQAERDLAKNRDLVQRPSLLAAAGEDSMGLPGHLRAILP